MAQLTIPKAIKEYVIHVQSPLVLNKDNLDHKSQTEDTIPYSTTYRSLSVSTFFLSSLTKPQLSPSFRPLPLYKLPIMHPWQQSQKPKKGESHHLHNIFYHIYIHTYIHIYFCICFLLAIAAASCFFSSTLSSSIVEVIKNSRFSLAAAAAAMKDRRGSAGVFPFSIGCMSQSAVDVADPHDKKSTTQNDPSSSASASAAMASAAQSAEEEGGDKAKGAAAVASSGIVATGVQRLIKGIKSLSQIFAMYDDDEEDEEEREMVIGYPTDVQHVGHIGWDGMNKVGGMVNAFSLPSSLSLRQLEMAMEAAHA